VLQLQRKNGRKISEGLVFNKFLKMFNAFKTAQNKLIFTAAHCRVTTAQFVIACTRKDALRAAGPGPGPP